MVLDVREVDGEARMDLPEFALQQQFRSHRSNFEREYELRERKQKPGEPI